VFVGVSCREFGDRAPAAQQAVAAAYQQIGSIDLDCRLAAYFWGWVGAGQRCCRPLSADPLGGGRDLVKYDDASWHSGGEFPEGSPDEYGGTHIALFLRWCFIKGWAGEIHQEEEPEDTQRVIEGTCQRRPKP
jgi:hypothetical protein